MKRSRRRAPTAEHPQRPPPPSPQAPPARHSGEGRNPENRDRRSHHGRGTPERPGHATPRAQTPAALGSGLRRYDGLGRAAVAAPANLHDRRPPPPPPQAHPLVIPAKAGIQKTATTEATTAGAPRNARDTPHPVPRHPPHWVPACAGMTNSNARGQLPLRCQPSGVAATPVRRVQRRGLCSVAQETWHRRHDGPNPLSSDTRI